MVVPMAALHEAFAPEPVVKSAEYVDEVKPVFDGHVFFVGSQSVDVCASVQGRSAAKVAAATDRFDKRMVVDMRPYV